MIDYYTVMYALIGHHIERTDDQRSFWSLVATLDPFGRHLALARI